MPASQRAAIDAFCFVAERIPEDFETDGFDQVGYLLPRVIARARVEFDYGDPKEIDSRDMASVRRAVRKLRSIVDFEEIDSELAARYVNACYNR